VPVDQEPGQITESDVELGRPFRQIAEYALLADGYFAVLERRIITNSGVFSRHA
jgi:hypothetical protein